VVGACNSGHDIAQDLYESGAEVTLVQRSSTYIMSQKYGIPIIFGGLFFEGGLPTPYADLLSSAYPWPVVEEFGVGQTKAIAELDRELLDRLEAVGFKLNYGPNNGGLMPYALRNGGGYYINVGASELIADRKIAIAQGSGVARFTQTGIELEDGRSIEADLVVLATGYSNMRETARRLFGDVVADRCEPVLGVGDDHELGALWKETGQPGFWFMGGPLAWVRIYSKYLALQIKGELVGLRHRD
jgi:putative flavoprotein involved in K+ transport